ncbi:serine/threonine-protein kinase [Spongiactinospora rosea]|nr:serine/threonine-protein kinase [Spongiactinospora rosea]
MAQSLSDGDPHRLGEYWLSGRLGAGGQGVVYEAYAPDGRRVAIKVLRGDPDGRRGLRDRLAREAASAQRVASFCTARVLDADLDGRRPYIVSEYVEGPSLRQAVAAGRTFTGGDLHRLATAVATALTAIHEAGVIHRDLKPDNVLLGPDGPRVIDFGVARTPEMSLTSTGLVTGTPTYMAPEIFMGQRAGTAADVFAWGGIMVFAATGEDPFRGESLGAVMHRVLSTDPDLGGLPLELRDLVGAALAKDPAERPAAKALLLALISGDPGPDVSRLLAEGSSEAREVRTPTGDPALGDPALGTLAEQAYEMLDPAEQAAVPEVFLRLVTVTGDGRLALRAASLAEITDGRPEAERVLAVFSYLVTVNGDEVTLARPALVHAWPRLRAWVAANRDGFAVHDAIAEGARRWRTRGRKDGDLFAGGDLAEALHWAATQRCNITLGPAERDFLEAAAALARRRVRRGRTLTAAMATLLALALIAGAFAVRQSAVADARRIEAEARRIAGLAEALRTTDPARAMLLGVAAWKLAPLPETREALTASVARPEVGVFRDPAASAARALSSDGRTLVSVSAGEVRIWDVRTGRRTGSFPIGESAPVKSVALSPNGRELAVTAGGRIRLWDLGTGEARPWTYRLPPDYQDYDFSIGYDQAQDLLAVSVGQGVTLWNTRTGRSTPVHDCCGPATMPDAGAVLMPSLDGGVSRIAPPGGERRALLPRCPGCAHKIALREDGRSMASGLDTIITLHDPKTGEEQGESLDRWNGGDLRFSHDGRLLSSITAGGLQIYRLHDRGLALDQEIPVRAMVPEAGLPPKVAFDPDGRTLRYLDGDTVAGLDLQAVTGGDERWQALSPDGRLVAGRDDATGEVRLRDLTRPDAEDHVLAVDPGKGENPRFRVTFSRDGGLVAASGHAERGEIGVWDTATGAKRATLNKKPVDYQEALAFSPDGRRLASLGRRAVAPSLRVVLWELPGGAPCWHFDTERVRALSFTPDGRSVAMTGEDGVRLLDATTGRPGVPMTAKGGAAAPDFASDGTAFAADDPLAVWRPGAAEYLDLPLRGTGRGVTNLAFSAAFSTDPPPEGGLAATADSSGDVTLWDVNSGRALGRPVIGQAAGIAALALSPDGRWLSTLDGDGRLARVRTDPEWLAAAACRRAGRTLTEKEWQASLPGLPYQDVCRA